MKVPLFKKKKVDPAVLAQDDAENSAEKKKRFRFRLSVKNLFQKKSRPEPGEAASEEEKPAKAKKPKKEKKPKEKKEKKKKDKPQKVKRTKKDGEVRKKPPIPLLIILGVVLVGGVTASVLLLFGGKTVEERLLEAAQYTVDGEYDKAQAIYDKLLGEDETLVGAYLGSADNLLAREEARQQEAVTLLTQGYALTGDAQIDARLKELAPEGTLPEAEPPPPGETPIVWQDAALEKMVRQAMNIPSPQPISEADVQGITTLKIMGATHASTNSSESPVKSQCTVEGYRIDGTLYTERGDIRSLSDLAHFRGLRRLTVGYNQVADISGIAGLTGLEMVALYFNDISDISPLASLSNLRYLYIYYNQIADIGPLRSLPALRSLELQANQISDLSPLGGLANLKHLYIDDNSVSDITPLRGHKGLTFLFAVNNRIADISAVESMPALTDVSFIGNPVASYAPAGHIQNVNRVD